jgi:hypothetical protein
MLKSLNLSGLTDGIVTGPEAATRSPWVVQPILITIIPSAQIAQSVSFITVDYLFLIIDMTFFFA